MIYPRFRVVLRQVGVVPRCYEVTNCVRQVGLLSTAGVDS
jgi:hypothetical protein